MTRKSMIVYFGGRWENQIYVGGESRFTLIPANGFDFEGLLHKLEEITTVDGSKFYFLISTFVVTPDAGSLRMDIKNDADLSYIVECSDTPKFYVVIDPRLLNTLVSHQSETSKQLTVESVTCGSNEDTSEMDDIEEDGGDYEDVEIESLDNDVPPSHGGSEMVNSGWQQWVIPGAAYHASLPIDVKSLRCNQYSTDTLAVGSVFSDKETLFLTLGLHHLYNRFQFDVERSSQTRYKAVCKLSPECPFLLQARCKYSAWRITDWEPKHTCRLDVRKHGPRTASSKVIGAYFAPRLLADGVVLRTNELLAELKRSFGVDVGYKHGLAGRNQAIRMIYGDPENSFAMLPSYLHMVTETNPGSIVALQTDRLDCFQYMFMALSASIFGFQSSCRPVIVVDGTHLKGKYKGVMFVAATKDGNEQIFPLAVGLGDKENNESWIWFLRQVRRAFGCPSDLLIVSDQHVSIKHAVATVYPDVPHGICIYHLQKNLGGFNKDVHALFQRAAHCYRASDFEKQMKALQDANEHSALRKLQEADPTKWARSHCPVRRYRFMTSNSAESINGRLRWARRLPICTMLECVRTMIGHWIVERRMEGASRTEELTEYAMEKLDSSVEIGQLLEVEPINMYTFKVVGGKHTHVVDLNNKSCTCRQFDFDLIPCPHAAAAIFKSKQSYMSYVSSFYTMTTYREAYGGMVYPIPHPDEWKVPDEIKSKIVGFPPQPKQAGRPRVRRMKSGVCSRCKKIGHNRATCSVDMSLQQQEEESVISKSPKSRKKSCSICRAPDHNKRRCPHRV